ncbi:MAG: hypothetical protein ACJATL_000794 [Rickettsiales bacterium]|jgi:hypothetical protein
MAIDKNLNLLPVAKVETQTKEKEKDRPEFLDKILRAKQSISRIATETTKTPEELLKTTGGNAEQLVTNYKAGGAEGIKKDVDTNKQEADSRKVKKQLEIEEKKADKKKETLNNKDLEREESQAQKVLDQRKNQQPRDMIH